MNRTTSSPRDRRTRRPTRRARGATYPGASRPAVGSTAPALRWSKDGADRPSRTGRHHSASASTSGHGRRRQRMSAVAPIVPRTAHPKTHAADPGPRRGDVRRPTPSIAVSTSAAEAAANERSRVASKEPRGPETITHGRSHRSTSRNGRGDAMAAQSTPRAQRVRGSRTPRLHSGSSAATVVATSAATISNRLTAAAGS